MIESAKINCPEIDLINELPLKTLKSHDLQTEFTYLMNVVEKLNSPIVFAHNDFRSSNILVTDSSDVLLVDFEITATDLDVLTWLLFSQSGAVNSCLLALGWRCLMMMCCLFF